MRKKENRDVFNGDQKLLMDFKHFCRTGEVISLYNINQFDQCAAVSALMNMSSKEIGSIEYFLEAQNLIIEHAFRKLNLRRIEAAANDSKLCHMNEKLFGFKCEGVLKEKDFINGIFTDRYILAILKKDWDRRKHKI